MSNRYQELRGRNRFEVSGVSDVMIRLKDIVLSKEPLPVVYTFVPPTSSPYGVIVNNYSRPLDLIINGTVMNEPEYGTLKWQTNASFGRGKTWNAYRDRFFNGFRLKKTSNIE